MAMAVTCHVKIGPEAQTLRLQTFQEVPRVGEFVSFSRDGKRDEDGVLHLDLFRVRYVIHAAANDLSPATVTIDLVPEEPADRAG
jgi:hypothetical protein